MAERTVNVKSGIKGRVGVNLPDLRFKREWPKINAVIPMDFEVVKDALFDEGFARMIKDGILIIEDKQTRIDLGLEGSDAIQQSAKVTLNEMQMLKLLKVDPIDSFKTTVDLMSKAQIETVCDLAIEKEIYDFEKTDYLKSKIGIDVRRTIELNRQDKEDVKPAAAPVIPGQNQNIPPFLKK